MMILFYLGLKNKADAFLWKLLTVAIGFLEGKLSNIKQVYTVSF